MEKIFWPILLQIFGVLVIIAEFVLPSAGLLTVVALSLIGYSLYLVFTTVSIEAGIIFASLDLLLLPILVIIGIKMLASSPVTLRSTLKNDPTEPGGPQSEESKLLGAEGIALTDLRPSGKALVMGKKLDVVSQGSYIPNNTPIVICLIDSNRTVVREKTTNHSSQNSSDTEI